MSYHYIYIYTRYDRIREKNITEISGNVFPNLRESCAKSIAWVSCISKISRGIFISKVEDIREKRRTEIRHQAKRLKKSQGGERRKLERGNPLRRGQVDRWYIGNRDNVTQCNVAACAPCASSALPQIGRRVYPMRSGEWASERANKAVKQPVRLAGRQACPMVTAITAHASRLPRPRREHKQTSYTPNKALDHRPFIVSAKKSLPRIGAVQLRRMHRYRKNERSLIVSAPRDVRLPLLPSSYTSEYRWLSTSVRREHYIEKRTPVNWIAVIVLALYWFHCLWRSFVWCCVINLSLVLFSLNG